LGRCLGLGGLRGEEDEGIQPLAQLAHSRNGGRHVDEDDQQHLEDNGIHCDPHRPAHGNQRVLLQSEGEGQREEQVQGNEVQRQQKEKRYILVLCCDHSAATTEIIRKPKQAKG
jgi:hypothetical protein